MFPKKHPVLTFLLINFAWTWFFWLAAIPFRGETLLVLSLVMIGGYGPAVGGIATLAAAKPFRRRVSWRRILAATAGAALIFAVMAARYLVGNIPGYETLAADLTLSAPVVLGAVAASLVGGWVISGAVSSSPAVRSRMASILPWRATPGWSVLGILFYPAMILAAWGLASLVGAMVEYPGLWERPIFEKLPLYALTFALVALAQGGNEEPGWRGFLQPELQKRFSPLVAAVIVSLFWSLWHLPLYLNGFYPGDLVLGMTGSGIYRVLLAIFLAWFYNRSGGNLFAMVLLHTSFNIMVNFLPTTDLGLLVLWLVVVIAVVIKDKMYRPLPADSSEPAPASPGTAVAGARTS